MKTIIDITFIAVGMSCLWLLLKGENLARRIIGKSRTSEEY